MKIVADTNIFLAVTLCEPERDNIIKLTLGHDLIAPYILPFEIGNALSAMLKRDRLVANEIFFVWDAIQKIDVSLHNVDIYESLKIASQFNIYAYDAYFLECAISLNSPLITLDRRMNDVARKLGVRIIEVDL